ncbi:protein disulfide isomerase [Anaeramoeba flamelloides]|uniref:Protein disulfide isomerase n=1 Tax=Anaeramoeba flamelloides TaxID=1746091 RepID=A0ABQ8X2A9_9EUKA|nr:protein disulfide isomerase [Anaeramoeba flamelloides]
MKLTIIFLLLAINIICYPKKIPRNYIQITNENYEHYQNEGTLKMIHFKRPHCKPCEWAESEFKKLSLAKPEIKFGVVDCTKQKALCQDFKITNYPTVYYCGSERKTKYLGNYDQYSLQQYLESIMHGKLINEIGKKELQNIKELLSNNQTNIVVIVPKETEIEQAAKEIPSYSKFLQIAQKHQGIIKFWVINEQNLPKIGKAKESYNPLSGLTYSKNLLGGLLLLSIRDPDFEAQQMWLQKEIDELQIKAIEDWVLINSLPLMVEYSFKSFHRITLPNKLILLSIVDPNSPKTAPFVQQTKQISVKENRLVFAMVDGISLSVYIKRFGIKQKDLPSVVIVDYENQIHYLLKNSDNSPNEIIEFIDGVFNQEIQPNKHEANILKTLYLAFKQLFIIMKQHAIIASLFFSFIALLLFVYSRFSNQIDGTSLENNEKINKENGKENQKRTEKKLTKGKKNENENENEQEKEKETRKEK